MESEYEIQPILDCIDDVDNSDESINNFNNYLKTNIYDKNNDDTNINISDKKKILGNLNYYYSEILKIEHKNINFTKTIDEDNITDFGWNVLLKFLNIILININEYNNNFIITQLNILFNLIYHYLLFFIKKQPIPPSEPGLIVRKDVNGLIIKTDIQNKKNRIRNLLFKLNYNLQIDNIVDEHDKNYYISNYTNIIKLNSKGGKKYNKMYGGDIDIDISIKYLFLLIILLNINKIDNTPNTILEKELFNNLLKDKEIISPIINTCITGISFLHISSLLLLEIYNYSEIIYKIINEYLNNELPEDINLCILFLTHNDLKIKKNNKYNNKSFNNFLLNKILFKDDIKDITDIVDNNTITFNSDKLENDFMPDLLFHSKKAILKKEDNFEIDNNDISNFKKEIPMIVAIQKGSDLDIVLTVSGNMFWMYLRDIFDEFFEFDKYHEMINEDYVYSLIDLLILNQNIQNLNNEIDKDDNIYYNKKENIICYVNPKTLVQSGGNKIKKGGLFETNNDNNTIQSKLLKIKFYMAYLIMLNPFLTSLNIHNILQKLINIIYKDESVKDDNVNSDKYIEDLGLINYCNNIGKYYINHLSYI